MRVISRFIYLSVHDFLFRLKICREHMVSILHMEEFFFFLSGLWHEFFNASDFFILILNHSEKWYRIVSSKEDHFYRLESQTDQLLDYLHAVLPGKEAHWKRKKRYDDILRILNQSLCVNHLLEFSGRDVIYVLGFYSPKLMKNEEISRIREEGPFLAFCLDQILYFEHHKNCILHHLGIQNGQNWNIQELKNQNLILQYAYDRIKKLQDELLIKEKKAAVIKFAISLDDEISNPLTNLIMSVQYHLEKYRTDHDPHDSHHHERLLDIIIEQSLRIKSILDQLREVTEGHVRNTTAG